MAIWMADYDFLLPIISLGIFNFLSIIKIIRVLKMILLAILKSASNKSIALSLETRCSLDFFSNIIKIPFIYQAKGLLLLIARFIKSAFICDIVFDIVWAL